MKNRILGLMAVCLGAFVIGMTVEAGTVEGTVGSVDAAKKTIEVKTAGGSSVVTYTDATKWPAGTTDPATLAASEVKVTTDDATAAAVSVETVTK